MPVTNTVQSVVNFASAHVELMPLASVGGFNNEPALSLANDTMAEILAYPSSWKFNRATLPVFVAAMNKQDFKFAGACAFTLTSSGCVGGVGIKLKSANGITSTGFPGTVTVNTYDAHNFNVGDTVYLANVADTVYNSTETVTASSSAWSNGYVITGVPTPTSFTFAALAGQTITSGALGITDFGWGEYATMVNETDGGSPRGIKFLECARSLEPASRVSVPTKVMVTDNQDGTVNIRLWELPGSAPWGITITYQKKAAPFVDLTASWSPIPDEYAFMYRKIFLEKAYEYIRGAGYATEAEQNIARVIAKGLTREDAENDEEYIVPVESLMALDF